MFGIAKLNNIGKFTAAAGRTAKTITAVGNAQVDTAISKFGGASLLLDGTGDYLRSTYSSDYAFMNTDFTVECWFYATNFNTTLRILAGNASSNNGWRISIGASTSYWVYSGTAAYSTNMTVNVNTWYHFAAVKSGSTIKFYLNGTEYTLSGFSQRTSNTTSDLYIGIDEYQTGSQFWLGSIDEFRISNNARYTASFTAPTAPFVNDDNTILLIHADGTDASTYFEDDNGSRLQKGVYAIGNAQVDTAQSKFGGTSALFDGAADGLYVASSSDLGFGTNDFTIEGWIRFNNFTSAPVFIDMRDAGTTQVRPTLYFDTSGVPLYFTNGATRITGSALSTGVWYHIALSRSGTNTRLFVNGSQVGSTYSDSNNYLSSWIGIGIVPYNTSFGALNGWIDELRISNTARYTANFTAPTAAFTNDANTILLIHANGTDGSTTFTDDNA